MKKIFYIIIAIIVLAGGGFFIYAKFFRNNWQPLLEEKLKQTIVNSTDSLYHIEYDKLDISPIDGNLTLINFKLLPNLNKYQQLQILQKAPDNIYELKVKALKINNVNSKEAVLSKKIRAESIIILNPNLIIKNKKFDYNDTIKVVKQTKELHELIKDIFQEIKVRKILLQDINLCFIDNNNKIEKKSEIKNVDLSITDISIDSASFLDSTRIYYTKDISVNIKNYKYPSADSLYFINIKNLNFSSSKNLLAITDFNVQPRLNKSNYHKKLGHAQDRFDINFKDIKLSDFDFNRFLKRQKLFANKVIINDGSLEIYNTNAYKKIIENKTGKFPHQQLLKLNVDLKIKEIELKKVNIIYSEYNYKSKKIGHIDFLNTHGNIRNIVNDQKYISQNPIMSASLKTYIYGKAPLNLSMNFHMNNSLGKYNYNGVINSFDGKILNNIIKPLGMAEINTADIQKLSFNVNANQNVATGTMEFYYKNLNVNILKRDDENNTLKKQGLISTVANTFFLQTDNPNKKGEFTKGIIYYERPNTASFFNFLWKSLFTGAKSSVGIGHEKETKIKNTAEKVGNTIDDVKDGIKSAGKGIKSIFSKKEEDTTKNK